MRPWTGVNLKVVERRGQKLQDLLCKSNPWDNTDCGRTDCFTCISTTKSEKPKFSNCYQKSVVYETWWQTCLDANSENEISNNDDDHENIDVGEWLNTVEKKEIEGTNEKKRKTEKENGTGPLYRYIGESSRTTYERGGEHRKDLEFRRTKSHLLRHCGLA